MRVTNRQELRGWTRHCTNGKWNRFQRGDYVIVIGVRGWVLKRISKNGTEEVAIYHTLSDAVQRVNKELDNDDSMDRP